MVLRSDYKPEVRGSSRLQWDPGVLWGQGLEPEVRMIPDFRQQGPW